MESATVSLRAQITLIRSSLPSRRPNLISSM